MRSSSCASSLSQYFWPLPLLLQEFVNQRPWKQTSTFLKLSLKSGPLTDYLCQCKAVWDYWILGWDADQTLRSTNFSKVQISPPDVFLPLTLGPWTSHFTAQVLPCLCSTSAYADNRVSIGRDHLLTMLVQQLAQRTPELNSFLIGSD